MAHFSDKEKSTGKDYCIFFNSQWARLPQDLNKAVSHRRPKPSPLKGSKSFLVFQSRLQIYDLTTSVLCSPSEVPEGGFPNCIPMVLRGNCTFYEKVRLAQIHGAKGLLVVSKDRLVIRPLCQDTDAFEPAARSFSVVSIYICFFLDPTSREQDSVRGD